MKTEESRKRYLLVTRQLPPPTPFPWWLVVAALSVGVLAFLVLAIVRS